MENTKFNLALDNIKFPVFGDSYGHIFDSDNNMICQVRGWGRIQYMDKPDVIMGQTEELIVTALNEYNDRLE